jgi:thiol-disulfide isomerase/thioredoxin
MAPATVTARTLSAVLLAGAVVLTGCDGSTTDRSRAVTFPVGGSTVTYVPEAGRGQPVQVAGVTLDGARADAATYRGAPVVLNVWASDCAPCREEAPELQAAWLQLRPSGTGFIGIDQRSDDAAAARAFQRGFGITYPSITDTDGRALLALRGTAPPNATPTTLVLDTRGRVAARVSGAVDRATLVALVDDVRTGRTPTR